MLCEGHCDLLPPRGLMSQLKREGDRGISGSDREVSLHVT